MKYILMACIRFYQMTISKMLPPTCRFEPSCSHYGYEAIARYGAIRGSWLTIKRLVRCQPFNPGGYDPVPDLWPQTFKEDLS
jgi:putative membrane protein insertion efficiency factor